MTSEPVPLTFGQEQLHDIAELLEPAAVVMPMAHSLRVVNMGALKTALAWVVRHHDALRMSIAHVDGALQQVALPSRPIEIVPYSADAPYQLDSMADASDGPLLVTVAMAERVSDMTLYLDHRLVDGWGAALVGARLVERYEAILRGAARSRVVADVPSFAAYAADQRLSVDGEAVDRHLAFWGRELEGGEPMELPLAERPWTPGLRLGERPALDIVLVGCSASRLTAVRGGAGSVAAVVLAALASVTRDVTGQSDLLFETMMSDRATPAKRALVGCLVNSVSLRVRCPDEHDPTSLLRACVGALVRASKNQIGPFHQIGRHEAGSLLNRSPRVRIAFNHDLAAVRPAGAMDYPRRRLADPIRQVDGCVIAETRVRSVSDLFVEVLAVPEGTPLRLRLAYRSDLWSRESAVELGLAVGRRILEMAGSDA